MIGKEGRISTRGSVKDIFADIAEHIDAAIEEFSPEDITDLNGKHREKHPGCEGHELKTKAHPSFLKERDGYRQALPVATDTDTPADDGGGVSGKFQTDGPPAKHTDTELSLRVNILQKDVAELKKGGINKSSKEDTEKLSSLRASVDDLNSRVGQLNDEPGKKPPTANSRIKSLHSITVGIREKLGKFEAFQRKTDDAFSTISQKVSELESSKRDLERENEALKKQVGTLNEDIRDLRKTGGSMFRLSTYVKECDTELSRRIHQLEIKTNSDDAAALIRQSQIQEMSPLQMLSELKKDEEKELSGISEKHTEGTAEFDNAVAECIAKHKKLKEGMIAYQKGFSLHEEGDDEDGNDR